MADETLDPALINTSDGPAIIVAAARQGAGRSSPPHSHPRGQLFGSMRGLLTIGVDDGVWVVPTTHAIWVPPHRVHWARSHGPFHGYAAYVAEPQCAGLPAAPCAIRMSGLLREATLRRPLATRSAGRGGRTAGRHDPGRDPQPAHRSARPAPAARRPPAAHRPGLVDDPAIERGLDDWARWAGIGARSLSRHCVTETGFTLTEWRRRARLMRALELLAEDVPVTRIALDLGYSTPSTFIGLFRRTIGVTPAAYRQRFET
ncbi:AraC family transcriptional regulator [Pseudoduganella plicata]|uniref:AraC family transcriptional regulator n=1 Tax=Pseudoduganella plicata TaxID=321984 RepID=A0AA87Y4V9_9BURK|nr:AraC family transcriptional regulator [Pseudoduganella plicata]